MEEGRAKEERRRKGKVWRVRIKEE
jgi:hypothetical protein